MKYLKLFESEENTLDEIKKLIKGNNFLSKYADGITEDSIKEYNDYIYVEFPDGLNSPHINKHFDKKSTGSVWSISKEEVYKLILDTLNKNPSKEVKEGPTFKYKWLNIEHSKQLGFDSLKKVDGKISKVEDLEPFGMTDRVKEWSKIDSVAKQNGYNLVTKEGDVYTEEHLKNNLPCFIKQEIGVIYGDKMENPTKTYNLITAKVGEVGGKSVLTLMTVFPGINPVDKDGKDITNKKDLMSAGYALIRDDNANENIKLKYKKNNIMKHLKTFESFSNYITENSDFDKISDDIENFGDVDYDENPPYQVLEYLFNLISKSNEFKSYTIKSNESDLKLSISNNDRKIEIELDNDDDDGIIMKFTDGDDVFQPTIVSVEETGGEESNEDPIGGLNVTYDEQGYEFELDKEKFKSSLSSIKNYLSGEVEYLDPA